MTLRPFVSAALVYAFVQSVVAASADSSWFDGLCDGLFDAPVGESTADRLERPPEDFRNRVVDHELGRPKRSSDTMYYESPVSSHQTVSFSSSDDYSLRAKSAAVVLAAIPCLAALVYILCRCCRRCCPANKEHDYCDMKCRGRCAFSSCEQ